jgi:TRAP-type mannitol/chloroaromatic compound transport system permease small subunit
MNSIEKYNIYLLLAIVFLIGVDIGLRYLFSYSKVGIMELEWYLFALFVMLSIPYCTHKDGQVRVDIFYNKYSLKTKKTIEILSLIFLVFPWIVNLIYTSFRYSNFSFKMGEGSADPGGLPFRFLVKLFIPIGFSLLLLISFRELIRWISPPVKQQ